MRAGQAALLGLVQGVAEVVPVSSSAQLALLPELAGWAPPPHRTAFAAGLHAGSAAGIGWALRREVRAALADPCELAMLAAACVPAALVGVLVEGPVERRLGGPRQLVVSMAVAGLALAAADRRPQDVAGVGPREAGLAGLAQAAAVVPGVSRAGAVLTVLRLARVERGEAARFSLLLSLPVTGGAAAFSLARTPRADRVRLAPLLATGVPAAAVSGGLAATAWRRRPALPATAAAVYRLALAATVAARLARTRRRA